MTTAQDIARTFYVSTAIPYVNAAPHVGFAFEAILADVLARYHRLRGDIVHLQSGTDDNSLKNVQAAERVGVTPDELVNAHAQRFQSLGATLDLTYDDFVRTSLDERHREGVAALWQACAGAGDLYKKAYRGLYCVGCERFVAPLELQDGRCPEHGRAPDPIEEENWFFRLSRYRDRIAAAIAADDLRIVPQSRRNEVLAYLGQGLEDISVSRAFTRARGWGIPVPGDPSQAVYVWFDALGNYVNSLGWYRGAPAYERFWIGGGRRVHVIGKGILRFHAVHWPAILFSAGLPLPTDLLVHGYLTVDGTKIGKSLGNAVDPEELVDRFGVDAVRYYLLRHQHPFLDGDFSASRLQAARDAELADQLGNLLRRTVVLVQRHFSGVLPGPGAPEPVDTRLREQVAALAGRLDECLEGYVVHEALAAIFEVVTATNRYLESTAPWALARGLDDPRPEERSRAGQRLATVLFHAAEALRIVGLALTPFVPGTSAAVCAQLSQEPAQAGDWTRLGWGRGPWERPLLGGKVLFPKVK